MKQKIKTAFIVGILLASSFSAVSFAASESLSHPFAATSSLSVGSLVSLTETKANEVEPANAANGARLVGVVVNPEGSLLAIDPTKSTVQVAISGTVDALASTVNGPISVGDQVSVSPFSGIGMRASLNHRLIGFAQSTLDDSTPNTIRRNVTDISGKQETITVGYIKVSIGIGPPTGSDQSLNPIQKAADIISGHIVSKSRVLIASIVAILGLIALITLIYTSIYGSFLAIGRNPLAKKSVFRSLLSVTVIALAIALILLSALYVLLS